MTSAIYTTDDDRWQAVVNRDVGADGVFVYSVKTTGVYCRPSCASRQPRRENVRFFTGHSHAEQAGFRPCKRCKPNQAPVDQQRQAVVHACQLIEQSDVTLSLETLASAVGMSPSHFQRLFKAHVGITPKAFGTAQRAKKARQTLATNATVTSAAYSAGFASSGRFYSATNQMLGMTPTIYRTGGAGLTIRFAVGECSLGAILVAATPRGICAISLGDDPGSLLHELQDRFHQAELVGGDHDFEQLVASVITLVDRPDQSHDLPLDICGTAFQQRVWQALRDIPGGQKLTYSALAAKLGQPQAVRAVASACAANMLAVAIPCHRVVRTDGSLSGYRWGIDRKAKLLQQEGGALLDSSPEQKPKAALKTAARRSKKRLA